MAVKLLTDIENKTLNPITPPAGLDTQIQFNSGSTFGSNDKFVFSASTKSLTLGYRNPYGYADGLYSFTQGKYNIADAAYSHGEGKCSYARGIASHAEGKLSSADGYASHAEGRSLAYGNCSHSEGWGTRACGDSSHAEGVGSCAFGCGSHAEGRITHAYGFYSHTEGKCTQACGDVSHAEGYRTHAIGDMSRTSGYGGVLGRNIFACGSASFNHSTNTGTQIVGHGALADNSAILGGINHNIESGNTGAAIIGGNLIKLTGTTYVDTTAVSKLAIMNIPTGSTGLASGMIWSNAGVLNIVP